MNSLSSFEAIGKDFERGRVRSVSRPPRPAQERAACESANVLRLLAMFRLGVFWQHIISYRSSPNHLTCDDSFRVSPGLTSPVHFRLENGEQEAIHVSDWTTPSSRTCIDIVATGSTTEVLKKCDSHGL